MEQHQFISNVHVDIMIRFVLIVMHKIKLWEGLQPEVRDASLTRFAELQTLTEGAISQGIIQDIPLDFINAMLAAQAETTMQFMRQDKKNIDFYLEAPRLGLQVIWNLYQNPKDYIITTKHTSQGSYLAKEWRLNAGKKLKK